MLHPIRVCTVCLNYRKLGLNETVFIQDHFFRDKHYMILGLFFVSLSRFFDTSKQALGAAVIHFANVFLADAFQGDPCTWWVLILDLLTQIHPAFANSIGPD